MRVFKRIPLGEIASVSSGGTPDRNRPEFWAGEIPWVKTGEIRFNTIRSTEERITEAGLRASAAKIYPEGTILMAMYGQGKTRGQVAKLGVAAAINQACAAIVPSPAVDSDFLFQFLAFNYSNIRRLSNSGSQQNLNSVLIRSVPVPSLELPTQRKIADTLTTWDEALEKLDALIRAKENRKRELMQQLLTGRKRLKGFKRAWKNVQMSEVLGRVFRPIDWSPSKPLSLVSLRRRCGGLFCRPAVLASDYKTQDLHELKAGDFLISKRQVVHGAWALVSPEFERCHVSKEYVILVNAAPDTLHMPFFAWLAQTPRMIHLARTSSTGVHMEKLIFDPDVFLHERIRIPRNIAEQQHIASILDAAHTELQLLRAQRAALERQKRGLMQRLLTGRVRVKTSTPKTNERK